VTNAERVAEAYISGGHQSNLGWRHHPQSGLGRCRLHPTQRAGYPFAVWLASGGVSWGFGHGSAVYYLAYTVPNPGWTDLMGAKMAGFLSPVGRTGAQFCCHQVDWSVDLPNPPWGPGNQNRPAEDPNSPSYLEAEENILKHAIAEDSKECSLTYLDSSDPHYNSEATMSSACQYENLPSGTCIISPCGGALHGSQCSDMCLINHFCEGSPDYQRHFSENSACGKSCSCNVPKMENCEQILTWIDNAIWGPIYEASVSPRFVSRGTKGCRILNKETVIQPDRQGTGCNAYIERTTDGGVTWFPPSNGEYCFDDQNGDPDYELAATALADAVRNGECCDNLSPTIAATTRSPTSSPVEVVTAEVALGITKKLSEDEIKKLATAIKEAAQELINNDDIEVLVDVVQEPKSRRRQLLVETWDTTGKFTFKSTSGTNSDSTIQEPPVAADQLLNDTTALLANPENLAASISQKAGNEFSDAEWITELTVKVIKNPEIEIQPGTTSPTAASPTTAPKIISPTPAPSVGYLYADGAISVFSCRHFIIFGLSLFALIL